MAATGGTPLVPAMILFGMENSASSFKLFEVNKSDTLEELLEKCGPEGWEGTLGSIEVKVAHSKQASFDKFNLKNTVDLILRVLKSDVLWIKFEKTFPKINLPTKNAFEVLFSAQNVKTLPDKLENPFTQKLILFNKVVDVFKEKKVGFSKSECAPKIKNRTTGNATQLVYDIADILWKIKLAEKALKRHGLWSKFSSEIVKMLNFDLKYHEKVVLTQLSTQNFASHTRDIADRVIFSNPNLQTLRVAFLGGADVFDDLSRALKANCEKAMEHKEMLTKLSTAAEAVVQQISDREKVTLLEKGSQQMCHALVKDLIKDIQNVDLYQPLHISNKLPTNRSSRFTFLNRTLPRQTPIRLILWSFDNGSNAPQSIFAIAVKEEDTPQKIFDKISQLKPKMLSLQKFFFPREFYHQFHDQAGSVTGISNQNFKMMSAMVMGDDRKMPGDVRERFEEAMFSADPEAVNDLRFFNGREVQFKEFLKEFQSAVEEFMVEDRGRHEMKYDGTVISKVSVGFSLSSVFREVCKKVINKNPNCPLPQSESFLHRYLIPRTKAAAESASSSVPLIPLKLAMQQKVIEKPNVDAYYNSAQYKYLRNYAVELGDGLVTMVGWDDKTGVDIGEPDQPTAATQNPGKSWVQSDMVVGEGQHSFHKTNLTPSVRLIHHIPEDITGSFYRGEPQVSIKDSIFEHSTSARHATELLQMFRIRPELVKEVLILTNDGGVDHTIRHARNVVSILALFLHFPKILLIINFQMAAYRSAYHPVEKLNCILNLGWNGVCLSRESLSDPVLEQAFSNCSSMADARKLAEKHPGLKAAVKESIKPAVNLLEERAKQGSLKENFFETFDAATDEDIEQFLAIVKTVDPEFDVNQYLDKKKPFHYTPALKLFIEEHVTFTHYCITFKRHNVMSVEFLNKTYTHLNWTLPLEPVPCPVFDSKSDHKFISYEELKQLQMEEKDFEDKCRPGKSLKVPANIPFSKNKQRAQYGSSVEILCDSCGKRRVVYFQHKPSKVEVDAAVTALKNTRYICGGRISSFGRSLAVMGELYDVTGSELLIGDEIDNSEVRIDANDEPLYRTSDNGDIDDEFHESDEEQPVCKKSKHFLIDDEFHESDEEQPVCKKSKKFLIESDEELENVGSFDSDVGLHFLSELQHQPVKSQASDDTGPCTFCEQFETGHKCRVCLKRCCNFCNSVETVEELSDIVCPDCFQKKETKEVDVKRGRGRPSRTVETGQILIPLHRKGRGRPRKETKPVEEVKMTRGRPPKELPADKTANIHIEDQNEEEETIDQNGNNVKGRLDLTEFRILGNRSIFTKMFVSEALTCDDAVEAHLYDILEDAGKVLPCFYCGEVEQKNLFSLITEEAFPLCFSCQKMGRGAGVRRKSRVIKPKLMKPKKPVRKKLIKYKKVSLID
jgi:hypothetical protein